MGSLYSKPKTPDPIFYTPQPAAPAASPTPVIDTPAASGGDAEKIASAVRRRSLPETILTSFRGVLQTGDWLPQRKSLLGE